MGMHLESSGGASSTLDARIWYTAYIMDKTQSCASGRPAVIRDTDCTVPDTAVLSAAEAPDTERTPDGGQFFAPLAQQALLELIRLCRIISIVQDELFTPGKAEISTVDALVGIGRADAALAGWYADLPLELRFTEESSRTGSTFIWTVVLSVQYHTL